MGVGADVAYDPENFDNLIYVLRKLTNKSSVVLMAERERVRSLFEPSFFEGNVRNYFRLTSISRPEGTGVHQGGDTSRVALHKLTKL